MTRESKFKEMPETFQGLLTSKSLLMASVREIFDRNPKIQDVKSPSKIDLDFPTSRSA